MKVYTHKKVEFKWGGGLDIYISSQFLPLERKQCNGVLYWQLEKGVRLSINQLKEILKHDTLNK